MIQALNGAPEAIEKLVKAAFAQPVDANGKPGGYGANTSYLDWLVGDEIRDAARRAVHTVVKEYAATIEAKVREGLNAESVVAAMTKAIVDTTNQEWRIDVKFAVDK